MTHWMHLKTNFWRVSFVQQPPSGACAGPNPADFSGTAMRAVLEWANCRGPGVRFLGVGRRTRCRWLRELLRLGY